MNLNKRAFKMASFRQCLIYGMIFASGTLIGYDSGYLNGVLDSSDFIHRYGQKTDGTNDWYLTPYIRSIFSSLLVVGTLLGSLTASFACDLVGRKGSMLFAAGTYAVGVSLQLAASQVVVFVLGRVLLGMGLGLISVILLTCGNVIACGISLGTRNLHGVYSWRITIGFQLFLALIVFVGAIIAPESPVLLMKANKPDRARQSLAALRNISMESEEMTESVDEISRWVEEQQLSGNVHLAECFQGSSLRRQMLGICMAFLTIATGVTFWFGYGTTFFEAAGIQDSYLISLILALVNTICTVPSPFLVERFGRRLCLLVGGGAMAITMLVTGIIHSAAPGSRSDHVALVVGAVLFIAAYAPSWGTIGWVIMTEPYSQRLRLRQTTNTMVIYWLSTWAVGFVTPYMVDATAGDLGVKVCYIWFAMIALSLVWAYLFVPELAGLSVMETDMLFEAKIPAWRSVAWQASLRRNEEEIESKKVLDVCNSK